MVKVLMFGWEYPPHNSGGLGIACQGLTRGLRDCGAEVIFALPKKLDVSEELIKFVYGDDPINKRISHYVINSPLKPYVTSESYVSSNFNNNPQGMYGNTLLEEVNRYGELAKAIAENEDFDVIHAHDWLTMKAGIAAKEVSKKPLIVHIHATEFDRTSGNNNQMIYNIEREGMHAADVVVTVSQWTKNKVVERYGVPEEKVRVVHNAVNFENHTIEDVYRMKKEHKKIVLFVGRITIQKGPDYFVEAAKRVTEKDPNAIFVFSGSGDMERQMIEKAAHLGIADKVLFAGFLRGNDLIEAFKMADVFVMPSVSEPFGLVPLESMSCGTPAIISKQSGVSEVISHCLKIDFWDVDDMSNKILSVLKYSALREELAKNGLEEVKGITWDKPAQKCISIYNELASQS
jgi:glycogen(starch) synthase